MTVTTFLMVYGGLSLIMAFSPYWGPKCYDAYADWIERRKAAQAAVHTTIYGVTSLKIFQGGKRV